MLHAQTKARPTRGQAGRTGVTSSLARSVSVLAVSVAVAVVPLAGVAAPAAAGTRAATVVNIRADVVTLTNVARAVKGCKPLKTSTRLTKAAQRHAKDMAEKDYYSHTSADGRTSKQRRAAAGWKKPGGENIAGGHETPASVHNGWMDSPGHRRNMLNCKFKYIGVGYSGQTPYWVQEFGS